MKKSFGTSDGLRFFTQAFQDNGLFVVSFPFQSQVSPVGLLL